MKNIQHDGKGQGPVSNGGQPHIDKKATLNGIGEVPFAKEGTANLLSMAKSVDQGFRVFINTDVEDAILVCMPDARTAKFDCS